MFGSAVADFERFVFFAERHLINHSGLLADISNTENVGAKHTSRIYHQFICSLSQIYQFKFHHNVFGER